MEISLYKSTTSKVDKELNDRLLRIIKREVKQIMEEAVTRKFVHEDSGSVTSFCAAVDACLSTGLKRRALGLFKTNSTTALLQKVAKNCEAASLVLKKVCELENSDPNKQSSSSSDSLTKNRMSFKFKSGPANSNGNNPGGVYMKPKVRYLWIRVALFEKHLAAIVEHVVRNNNKYYEKESLVSDPVNGHILASLLMGACALEYTKIKPQDQFWSDPPADELVQRHRISSSMVSSQSTAGQSCINQSTPPSVRKPLGLTYRWSGSRINYCNVNSEEDSNNSSPVTRQSGICWSPREYVESLHQNARSTLLFGKNNVIMQPNDELEPLPGYLSLHQDPNGLIIKWTPNELINGRPSQNSMESYDSIFSNSFDKTNVYWNYALNVNVANIVYLHCHHRRHSCGSIVMVGRDGVMHPPIQFPKGGHLLAFLSCLETGLTPYGQLDPPLWSQKGKGKVFPKLRRKGQSPQCSEGEECSEDCEDMTSDYVFRIISISDKPDSICPELFSPRMTSSEEYVKENGIGHRNDENQQSVKSTSSDCSVEFASEIRRQCLLNSAQQTDEKQPLQILCDTMRKQIISRAFYGWLAYCRHLKTVRTHLVDLVNQTIVPPDKPTDASGGITTELWAKIQNQDGQISIAPLEFYRLVYYGGIEHCIRAQVWPYLLEHYRFEDTNQDKKAHDENMKQKYEMIMSDWLAVEAIVRQRDKEIVAANLAKLSSESNNSTSEVPFSLEKSIWQAKSASNEVFEDVSENDGTSDSRKSSTQSEQHWQDKSNSTVTDALESGKVQEGSTTPVQATNRGLPSGGNRKLMRHRQVESVNSLYGQASLAMQNIFVTNPSIDQNVVTNNSEILQQTKESSGLMDNFDEKTTRLPVNSVDSTGSQCVSPASSNGGIYSNELLDQFSLNLHRIDKDVQRCDRNYWYFTKENLEKLRNVMCTYVWEHLELGYVQGMCDLVAPLLVIFDDEVCTYSCFCELMKRMASNFPQGGAMDAHFANLRSLMQILDVDVFELMHQNGDYTHFYFCYRWILLDFKRELVYADVFAVWETIWAAKHVSSSSFVLFLAIALIEYYRNIIIENNMDFTDIIKFFNEMAERHDAKAVLKLARDLVHRIQLLIDNK